MSSPTDLKQELDEHSLTLDSPTTISITDEKRHFQGVFDEKVGYLSSVSDSEATPTEEVYYKPPPRQFALIMLVYGKFSDIFGRKSAILFANILFLAGSAVSGWATSMNMLIIGRGVAGIGAGGLIPMAFIIISDMLDMRERSKYIGSVSGVHAFSSVIGPLLGGTFVDHATWRWSFWINLPIVSLSTLVLSIILNLPTPKGSLKEKLCRIDYFGTPTLMSAVILLLLALSWAGSKYEWTDGIIIGMISAGVALAVIFILIEWKIPKEPIVPIYLYKTRNLWATYAVSFFSGMSYFGILFYTPIYFQVVKGESATTGGLGIVPFIGGLALAAVFSGVWANKKGTYLFFLPLGSIIFTTGIALCILFKIDSPRILPIISFLICGIGMGFLMQTSTLAVQAAAEPKYMAMVTALVQFMRSLGQDNAFYGCTAFCVLAFISSCFIQHKKLRNNSSQSDIAATVEIA
ncbi:hypothetical protein BGX26_000749 [Mortierella sp. AD094]|nr:hypothetical protein BGX26_000749 [Mortierella sp. AD094]